jgi:hypothetical protein
MATAGEKFFESLTNGELSSMARVTGIRMEDWAEEASGINVNCAVVKVASFRAKKPLGDAQLDNMTPKQTQEKLEELLGELGFVDDDEDEVTPDLSGSEDTSPKPPQRKRPTSA